VLVVGGGGRTGECSAGDVLRVEAEAFAGVGALPEEQIDGIVVVEAVEASGFAAAEQQRGEGVGGVLDAVGEFGEEEGSEIGERKENCREWRKR